MISKISFWLSGQWGGGGQQIYRTVNEYLGSLDIKSRIANLYRTKMDYVGLLDIKSRMASLRRIFIENLGIIDSKIKTLNKHIIDHVALSDSKVKSLSKTINENIKLLDLKVKTLSKNIVQYLGLDGFRYIGGQIVSRIVTEIVTFSDNIKKITNTWKKIRGYFIEDYERLKKKRLLRLLRHYILLESEDE